MIYKSNQPAGRWRSFIFTVTLTFLLGLTITACGNQSSSTGSRPAATATATSSASTTNATGCPDSAVVTTPPQPASVVLKNSDSNAVINVNKGDTVEVDLPFGHLWEGPEGNTASLLAPQTPSGYAFAQVCVWRFIAAGTGTVHLTFIGRPICKMGQACPMYVMAVPFTIDIK